MRWQRGVVTLLLTGWLAGGAAAQFGSDAELERKYKAKLQKKFMKEVPWETRLSDALEKSAAEQKPVLGYFTRSYSP